ncbi:uncharacterized protein LOC107042049 [Diachasma alloeum]|uniref:uncharacterized protein LOC107042049 n=1 Tax=Diachasma alloeum TaxID=454923 RepID=UPI00073840B4|nr:uncharacterized protein LOC107042049 [Diachasma alloeum]
MLLQKWTSNKPELLRDIACSVNEFATHLIDDQECHRALGLNWDSTHDIFFFSLKVQGEAEELTKRMVLSQVAQLYDPLGWIGLFVVKGKLLVQELCKLELGWDEELSEEFGRRWMRFAREVRDLWEVKLPRYFVMNETISHVELHSFADASGAAYGAVVYLRVTDAAGGFHVTLVSAKSKLAPIKDRKSSGKVTIPRLELMATSLLSWHIVAVVRALEIEGMIVCLWTDSSVALSWIKSDPMKFKQFVKNRVEGIQNLVPHARWRHVAGEDNPADLISRGVSAGKLAASQLWWSGPSWLLVVTAWCRRIFLVQWGRVSKSAKKFESLVLGPEELEDARKFWMRQTQGEWFAEDLRKLNESKEVARGSQLFRLVPFLDGEGVMSLTGRLHKSSLEEDSKHPAISPASSQFTELVLRDVHLKTYHGGVQLMLTTLRRSYWILGGRRPVKNFIFRCVACTRHRGKVAKQLIGATTFEEDYACTTDGFLACYKRFVSRRGLCEAISSDQGTNLVGADKEMRKLFDAVSKEGQAIAHSVANDGTKWIFNPPRTPHHGGKWEAAVKSAKFHLKRVIGDALMTYEEFSTLLVQIEAILNSRPLCELPNDPDKFAVLTPGHFLIGSALSASTEYMQKLQGIDKWHRSIPNLQVGALVLIVDKRFPPTKWPMGKVIQLHLGKNGHCRVVSVRTQSSTFTRPATKICPLPVEVMPAGTVGDEELAGGTDEGSGS